MSFVRARPFGHRRKISASLLIGCLYWPPTLMPRKSAKGGLSSESEIARVRILSNALSYRFESWVVFNRARGPA